MADLDSLEQVIAHVFATTTLLLYYEIARDLFPGTPVHGLSSAQDEMVTMRLDRMIRVTKNRLLPPPASPPDHG
jgi:hypothetical protein